MIFDILSEIIGNAPLGVQGTGGDSHNLGWFATELALNVAHPTATDGDFAIVGTTDTVWVWDSNTTSWVDSSLSKGSSPAIGIQGTYTEHKAVASANNLIVGLWYEITDYETKFDAGEGIVITSAVESLTVMAVSTSKFGLTAFSSIFPLHEIDYDFENANITEYTYGEYEDGGDLGGDGTISNVTPTSFQVNQLVIVGDGFNLYVEDDVNGDYEYLASDEGIKYTITDIGGGNSRIDLIDTVTDPIDLTDASYNYIFFEALAFISTRKGYITRRKNREKNIECSFDYLNMKRVRRRIDIGAYTSWNSATIYNLNDLMERNGGLYASIVSRAGTISTPHSSSSQSVMITSDASNDYTFSQDNIGSVNLILDPAYKLIPTFSIWNGVEFIYNDSRTKNISIYSEDVVFPKVDSYAETENVSVSYQSGITLGGTVKNIQIASGSYNFSTGINSSIQGGKGLSEFRSVRVSQMLSSFDIQVLGTSLISIASGIELGGGCKGLKISSVDDFVLGRNSSNMNLGQMSFVKLGSASSGSYFRVLRNTQIKSRIFNIQSFTETIENLDVGYRFKNIIIEEGRVINNVSIGDDAGSINGAFIKTIDSNMNSTNIKQRFLYIGDSSHAIITPNFNNSNVGSNFRKFNCAGNVSYCNFENNVYDIDVSDSLNGLNIGHNSSNISLNRVQGGIIGSLCNNLIIEPVANGIEFGESCGSISILGNAPISSLEIKAGVSSLTIPSTATNMFNSTSKTIRRVEGGAIRMTYIDATNTLIIKDPTT